MRFNKMKKNIQLNEEINKLFQTAIQQEILEKKLTQTDVSISREDVLTIRKRSYNAVDNQPRLMIYDQSRSKGAIGGVAVPMLEAMIKADGRNLRYYEPKKALKTIKLGKKFTKQQAEKEAEIIGRMYPSKKYKHETGTPKSSAHISFNSNKTEAYIIMPLFKGTDLKTVMQNKLHFSQRKRIAYNLAKEMQRMHKLGIVHHDIKPANIMVDAATFDVKITDFGAANYIGEDVGICGTITLMAPEKLAKTQSSPQNDYFSFAATLALLFGVTDSINRRGVELLRDKDGQLLLDKNRQVRFKFDNELLNNPLELEGLFEGITGAEGFPNTREKIENLIKELGAISPADRPDSLQQAIAVLAPKKKSTSPRKAAPNSQLNKKSTSPRKAAPNSQLNKKSTSPKKATPNSQLKQTTNQPLPNLTPPVTTSQVAATEKTISGNKFSLIVNKVYSSKHSFTLLFRDTPKVITDLRTHALNNQNQDISLSSVKHIINSASETDQKLFNLIINKNNQQATLLPDTGHKTVLVELAQAYCSSPAPTYTP